MLRHALPRRSLLSLRALSAPATLQHARFASQVFSKGTAANDTLDRASSTSYTAPLAKTIRNIKLFSLSSLSISTLIAPVFFVIESDLDMAVRAAMVGVAILTSGVSTAIVAWVLKPYVVSARVLSSASSVSSASSGDVVTSGWQQGTRVPKGKEEEVLPMTMDQQDAAVTGGAIPLEAGVNAEMEAKAAVSPDETLLTMDAQDLLTTSGVRQPGDATGTASPAQTQQVEMTRLTLFGKRTTSMVDPAALVRDRNGRMFANLKTSDGRDWYYVHETTGFWRTLTKDKPVDSLQ